MTYGLLLPFLTFLPFLLQHMSAVLVCLMTTQTMLGTLQTLPLQSNTVRNRYSHLSIKTQFNYALDFTRDQAPLALWALPILGTAALETQ